MRMTAIHLTLLGAGLIAMPAMAQTPQINGGEPVAGRADNMAASSVDALLRQASQAARDGRLPLANELVERAETLVLTRSTIAGTEDTPVRSGAVAKLSAARAALGRRDVPAATALMAEASSMTSMAPGMAPGVSPAMTPGVAPGMAPRAAPGTMPGRMTPGMAPAMPTGRTGGM